MDEQGRPYYYSADGSRSEWELPKVTKHTHIENFLTGHSIVNGD